MSKSSEPEFGRAAQFVPGIKAQYAGNEDASPNGARRLRSIFAANLTLAGFIVREAANGMDALRLIDSAPPGLVVLDLGLPHVTGQDVLYELKQHAQTREIPILVVTGRDGPVVPGVDSDCVLMKPVDAAELVRQVRRCLGLEADSGL